MHRFVILIALLTLQVLPATGQTVDQEWNEISPLELEMGPPPEYPIAEAVVFFDIGRSVVERRWLDYHRHFRMKAFTDSGVSLIKNVSIEYYGDDELEDVQAQRVTPDGTRVTISERDFETVDDGDRHKTTISFDQADIGDILEVRYRIKRKGRPADLYSRTIDLFDQSASFQAYKAQKEEAIQIYRNEDELREFTSVPSWYFDHTVYCQLSRYSVLVGADVDYVYYTTQIRSSNREPTVDRVKFLTATAYKKHTWEITSIKPFSPDTTRNFAPDAQRKAIHFRLFNPFGQNNIYHGEFGDGHWKQVGQSFQGYIDEYLEQSRSMSRRLREILSGTTGEKARLNALYSQIQQAFTVDTSAIDLKPTHGSVADVFGQESGKPFEINLLMVQLLRMGKIDAWPVLVSTWDRPHFRRTGLFNHIIVRADINDSAIYMDVSAKECPPGSLPDYVAGDEGILVDHDDSRSVVLQADTCRTGRWRADWEKKSIR